MSTHGRDDFVDELSKGDDAMRGFGRVLRTAFRSTIRNPQIRDHEAVKE